MKISSLVRADFPFAPSRFPFFYGWWILVVTTIGIMSSIPGQTMGVGVYTDYLILHTGLNRLEISMAYMTGTVLSSLLLPTAGRLYDLWGSRVMIFLAGTGLGLALLLFSETVWVLKKLELLVPGIPRTTLGLFLMILTFLMLRQFGQGIMSMVSLSTRRAFSLISLEYRVLFVAVKNFLRPAPRPGSPMETRRRQQRAELGALLTDAEADELLDSGSTHPG